jgi:hypothetical protein
VSHLPPALAPWAAQLAPFAPELQVALGGLAQRLAIALGPASAPRPGPGEPDGLAGLARRGPYERLLLSEWLLAQELPDEFTRRAAAGEHLFLAPQRRTRAAGRRSVVLLDAGPDQLGAPRIAQLAALVVLAARAEARGAAFAWGVVQAAPGALVDGFVAEGARRFIDARSLVPPTLEQRAAWLAALPAATENDDLWLVGGPKLLGDAPPSASRLAIEDVTAPRERQVRLVLERRGAEPRSLVLELPPAPDCTRLLRDPFGTATAPPSRAGVALVPDAGILFAPSGRRLAVRTVTGGVLDVHVPTSPRERPGRPRHVIGAADLVGIGWRRRKASFTVAVEAGVLRVRHGRGIEAARSLPTPPASPLEHAPLRPCLVWLPSSDRIWVLDATGTLHVIGEAGGEASVASHGVAAIVSSAAYLAYVASSPEGLNLVVHDRRMGRTVQGMEPGTGRAFLHRTESGLHLASEDHRGGIWTVRGWFVTDAPDGRLAPLGGTRQLRPPPGAEVVGVILGPTFVAGLVVVESDRRQIAVLDGAGFHVVHEARSEIATAAVSPSDRTIAYLTRRGGLVAFSLGHGAPGHAGSGPVLLDLLPGGGP